MLEWNLQYADQIDWFEDLEAQGSKIPAMETRPVLYDDLICDYQAFNILSSSRTSGMGVGPIPFSEIKAYMDAYEIDDWDQRELFITRIRILDHVYLKWYSKKNG